ncbi:MAG: SDR family oxidoreductase [Actinomycetota bacterium]
MTPAEPAANRDALFSLSGRVVVITGAAGLLGREHAEAVATFGGNLVLLDLDAAAVEEMATALAASHDVDAVGLAVDITDEAAVEGACSKVLERFGRVDGLVNNAANNPKVEGGQLGSASRLENFTLDQWNADIEVGLTGAFLCAKHFGNAIFNTSEQGSIVNISSDLGLIAPDQRLYGQPGLPDEEQAVKPVTYSVTKAGLIGLTRYLATYWTRDGKVTVRCNAICPGGVANGQDEAFVSEVSSRIPLGRMAEPDEMRGTLVLLLSSASSYANGSVFAVDGGRTAW